MAQIKSLCGESLNGCMARAAPDPGAAARSIPDTLDNRDGRPAAPGGNTEGLIMIKRALGRSGLQIPP